MKYRLIWTLGSKYLSVNSNPKKLTNVSLSDFYNSCLPQLTYSSHSLLTVLNKWEWLVKILDGYLTFIPATAAVLLRLPLDSSYKCAMYFRQFRCIYAIYSLALLTAEYKLLGTGQVKKVNMPRQKKKRSTCIGVDGARFPFYQWLWSLWFLMKKMNFKHVRQC